ncbi:aldose epimerase family protein [Arenicella xantha]|uniref:Aldose 1-epimerase n=1 Tax=Arenicella xantha TaxID=644221 RepID=A0A395JPR0_9GAMM|nr:aldose epimerase family protein [Arenicella xantha]RBP53640.1 aldose 1-epimerase [Arenicella xantha]
MHVYTIKDGQGLSVDLLDYGARIIGIQFNDVDVACRYRSSNDYAQDAMYLGASIGPITNRIGKGQMTVLGEHLQMPQNEGENTLHSGGNGFDKQTWQQISHSSNSVTFKLHYDMALAGLIGSLTTMARYEVANGTLSVTYESTCDHATYLNQTNHVYLNLSGQNRPIDDHEFRLFADNFVEVDENNIPTGALIPIVKPFDYAINQTSAYPQLEGSSDHHFNVGDAASSEMRRLLTAHSKTTGIQLDVFGTSPGFQFYTGKSMNDPFVASAGFCVETQFAPDAINQSTFYSPVTPTGERCVQISEYRFSG